MPRLPVPQDQSFSRYVSQARELAAPDPIHARSETIDSKPTFATAFKNAQRGIARSFRGGNSSGSLRLRSAAREQFGSAPKIIPRRHYRRAGRGALF